ncbi:MAG: hypothetical protein Q9220_006983 [cf. Caloplaca sp. 1 TL-2023]
MPKTTSSSTSWFLLGRRKQTTASSPLIPTGPAPSRLPQMSSKSSGMGSTRSEPLGRARQNPYHGPGLGITAPVPSAPPSMPDNEGRRHNVLRRKPPSINQRSNHARTGPTDDLEHRAASKPQDYVSSPDLHPDSQPGDVFGVALPEVSASASYLPTRSAEQSHHATSSSRMASYNAHRAPKTPTPQLMPPLAPSFATSSGSSTRRSESPGSYSRTSTPTSISSYSPGIPVTSKSPLRPRQLSPTRSRPPVTRNRPGNNVKQELGVVESQGLSAVQELATSSSSSDTARGNDQPSTLSAVRETSSQQPIMSALSSEARNTNRRLPIPIPNSSSVSDRDSYSQVAFSTSHYPSKTPPLRPSREGTPRLEDVVVPSPIIRSNLSRLETTGHKRRESLEKPIPGFSHRSEAQSPSNHSRLERSTTYAPSGSVRSSRLPSPNPAGAASRTWPIESSQSKVATQSSSQSRTTKDKRELSSDRTASHKSSSRFGLFARKASPVRSVVTDTTEKLVKKGPAAGTGHEGYGKYARRGRSGSTGTSGSRGRSTSSNGTTSSLGRTPQSRSSSFTSREEPEMDDFLRDRLSPVIISGGRVSNDRNSGTELYRTTSGASAGSIIASDDSSLGGQQGRGGMTASRGALRDLPRGQEDLRSPTTAGRPTLATRRSLHRSRNFQEEEPVRVPAPINTRSTAPSPAVTSRDTLHSAALTTNSSLQLSDDVSEGREGHWLKSRKSEKPTKAPSKWNFFQRANAAQKKTTSRRASIDKESSQALQVAVTSLPQARSVAHYAMLDRNGQDIDDVEGLVPSLKDINYTTMDGLPAPPASQSPGSRRQEHKRSMLLPSPPTLTKEFTNTPEHPAPKVLFRQPPLVSRAPTEASKPAESRLQQIGRIPRVVSKRDRPHKPPPQSFSRPFVRGQPSEPEPLTRDAFDHKVPGSDRPILGIQTERIPFDPWGEQDSAKPASAPARSQAQPHSQAHEEFLIFPQRHNSEQSGSSSSGAMSFVVAAPGVNKTTSIAHDDEEVWNEYDDFLDHVESPAPLPADPFNGGNDKYSPSRNQMAPAPLRIRKDSSTSSTHSNAGQDFPPMTAAPTSALPSPPLMTSLLSPNMASSPMSFSDFIAGYGDRNRGSAVSKRQSSVSGSRYSQASVQSNTSEADQKRHTQIMAEKTRNSSGSQSNLRFSALMTSRWLSFGRVLFSPAHNEIQTTKQDRVLVLDGLGNDDWSFYCALTYPDATVYNLSSFKRMGTASARRRENGTVQSPANHRQIFHAGMSAPFPFPKGYFSAAVFRFPTATTENAYYNAVSECKRVLRPGGYLEISILDLDMINMGNRARRAVRGLKVKMQVAQSQVSLKPLSDNVQKMLGRRGFENLSRCMVTVPVAGLVADSRAGSLDERDISLGDMLKDSSPQGDEGITKMVSRVGRWWYTRCYEASVLPDGDDSDQSIWADRALLKECEKRETGLKLLICYAQKPLTPKRRTISL